MAVELQEAGLVSPLGRPVLPGAGEGVPVLAGGPRAPVAPRRPSFAESAQG